MKFIKDFLAYRCASKPERLCHKSRRRLAVRVQASAWFKRYGKYPVLGMWMDGAGQGEGRDKTPCRMEFPNIEEALSFINALRLSRWECVDFDLSHDALTNEDALAIGFYNETSAQAQGVFSFYCNAVAGNAAKEKSAEITLRAEELRYLREDADTEYFKEFFLDYRGILGGGEYVMDAEERAAALANPRIAHLVR